MRKINIAVDGFSGCGKSTTARLVAGALGYGYIDTGAMYRAVTLYIRDQQLDISEQDQVAQGLANIHLTFGKEGKAKGHILLNGKDVEDAIRSMDIASRVSEVSAIREVRQALVAMQQKMGREKGVVMDGRDIGTTVFPDAELKVFLTADVMIRAQRRQMELQSRGEQATLSEIAHNLSIRDHIDSTREESPLRQAVDAVVVDTSYLSIEEQVEKVRLLAISRMIV